MAMSIRCGVGSYALALAMIFAATPARAQGEASLRGQVTAEVDRSALPGTRLTLQEEAHAQSAVAMTDEGGSFSFQNLRPGDYTLTAERDGFAPRSVRFVLKPREVKLIGLALTLRPVQEQVEVSAGAVALASTYSPSSTVISAALFDAMPVAQRTNLSDAIVVAAPGMIRGHDDFVHVRGQELALNPIINGVSFWENPHAVFSSGASPDVIEIANVMTGGFSAEYGNRFGGVVDIVTKSGFDADQLGSVTLNAGDATRMNVSGSFGGHSGRLAYFLFGSAFQSDRFLSPPDPRAIHDRGRGGHGSFQLDARPNAANSLRVMVMGDGMNFDIPVTPLDERLRPAARARQWTRQQTTVVGWNRTFSTDTLLHTSFYQRWSRSRLLPASGPLTAIADTDRRLLTVGVKSDLARFVGRHAVKTGVDLVRLRPEEHLSYDSTGFRAFSHLVGLPHVHTVPISFEQQEAGGQVSAYVQDSIRVSNALTADLGVRVDSYRLVVSRTHVSPRVNLAYRLGDRGTVAHASYNHFFVPPPIENVLSSSAGLTASIAEIGVPLDPLPPTVEDQFEVGVMQPFRQGLQVGVTGYYRRGRDEVHTTVWPDARIYSYASFDRSRAYGLESRFNVPLVRRVGLSAYLNYALGRVYFYGPVTAGFITEPHHIEETGRFLAPMDQTHTLTSGVTYRHMKTQAWVSMALEYGSGTPLEADDHESADPSAQAMAATDQRVPGHMAANVSMGADIWHGQDGKRRLALRLSIENVTNKIYKVAQESVFTPGQYSIPRLISGGLTVRF
jgi:outer membrane receptor protein involved in Fe transport